MKKTNYFFIAAIIAVLGFFISQKANAFAPYIYEGFDYAIGAMPLNYNPLVPGPYGDNGIWKPGSAWIGYGGAFSNTAPWGVSDASPMVVSSLVQTGKYFNGNGSWVPFFYRMVNTDWNSPYGEYLDGGKLGKTGTTLWFSVILRPQLTKKTAAMGLSTAGNNTSVVRVGAFGGNFWGIRVNNATEEALSTVPVVNDEAKFVVFKIEYTGATGGTISIFINPTPGVEPVNPAATLTTAFDIKFSHVQLIAEDTQGSMAADEIRIASTYAEAAPSNGPLSELKQNKLENIVVYGVNGTILADLTNLKGASIVTLFDLKGAVIEKIQYVGSEKVAIKVANKGLYIVRIQNSGKETNVKVAI